MNHTFLSTSPEATQAFAASVAKRVKIRPEWGKIILLSGEFGAGKTTFTKGFFEELGCTEFVKSPTFTYFQEYETLCGLAIHGDLYRLSDHPDTESSVKEHLKEYLESGNIFILEWANILKNSEMFLPDHVLIEINIERTNHENERKFTVKFSNSGDISEAEILLLMKEYKTPVHVRKHIHTVASLANKIAQAMFAKGIFLDPELVKNGALAHDLVKYVDFPNFDDPSLYDEELTQEKLQFWKMIQSKYETTHHGAAIGEILRERGYFATAEVAENHMTARILKDEPLSWEDKIVWYADKRSLHDGVVDLKKRFEDGRKRYGYGFDARLEKKAFELEAEIFENLDIGPEDISEDTIF